ncbi:MAG: cell shape determination protein CcmA [Chthonomonadaceae bacterium]|nr:cell shape determination protein CcmA [Chthonomonadaceae bacterium]
MALKICPNGHESEVAASEVYCPICLAAYPAPTRITGLHPTSGPSAGKTVVTITGSGFGASGGDTEVFFGTAAGEIQSVTDTAITVIAPPGTGPVSVTLRTGAGALTLEGAQGFTYVAAPHITDVQPRQGLPGQTVTLTGSGLGNSPQGVQVLFGDRPGRILSITETVLVVVAPVGSETTPVRVTTPHGDSTPSRETQFTYVAPLVPPVPPIVPSLPRVPPVPPLPIPVPKKSAHPVLTTCAILIFAFLLALMFLTKGNKFRPRWFPLLPFHLTHAATQTGSDRLANAESERLFFRV